MEKTFKIVTSLIVLLILTVSVYGQQPRINFKKYRSIPGDSTWIDVYQTLYSGRQAEAEEKYKALSQKLLESENYASYLFLNSEYSYWLRLAGGKSQPSADLLEDALTKVRDKLPEDNFDVLFARYYLVLHSAEVEDKLKWADRFFQTYDNVFPNNKLVNFNATVHMISGTASYHANDIKRAWRHWDYCRNHLDEIRDPLWFIRKVASSVKMSQPETALALYKYVYDNIMETPGNWQKKFTVAGNYIVHLTRLGKYEKAIQYGEESLQFFNTHLEEIKKRMRPHAVIHLALIDAYMKTGRYDEAFEVMEETYDILPQLGYQGQTKSALQDNKRMWFANKGMVDSALSYLEKAHQLNVKVKTDPEYIAYNYMDNSLQNDFRQFGDFYTLKNQYRKASDYYKRALRASNLKYYENIDDTTYLIPPEEFRGVNTETTMKVVDHLLDCYTEWYKNTGNQELLHEILYYANYGNNILKEQFKSLVDKESILATSEMMKRNNSHALFACEELSGDRPKYIDSAFVYTDMPRAFSLSYLKQLKNRKLSEEEDSLMLEVSRLSVALDNYNEPDTTVSKEYVNLLMDLLRAKMLLSDLFNYESKIVNYKPEAEAIKKQLAPNQALLSYFITDSVIYSICYTDEEHSFKRKAVPGIYQKISKLKRSLKSGSYTAEQGRPLYEDLIAPFEEELNNVTGLKVIADEKMSEIPIEILTDANNQYLIDRFAVQYYYSAKKMGNKEVFTPQSLLAVAPGFMENDQFFSENVNRGMLNSDEIFRGNEASVSLVPLTFSIEEVQSIKAHCKSNNIETAILRSQKATEYNFKQEVKGRDIIHIATHGISGNEYESGLFFTFNEKEKEDGFLRLPELYRMDLDANLVVLSACKTASGEIKEGEGVLALPRGFIYAGVPNIIASLWKVHDEKTKYLMVQFYKHLTEGSVSYDKALQRAKLDGIAQGFLPMDWAGFILISE